MNKLFERWSEKFDYDVAVIGAGSGGLTAAVGCRKFGLKTVLIDGGQFGGDCLNFGCVPSKTLIACAKVSQNARDADRFGINCSLPTTDWEAVKRRMASVKDTIRQHENPDYFRRMGMTVLENYAAFHDSHTLDVGDSRLTARYIVIATGSRPKIPPIPHLVDVGFLNKRIRFRHSGNAPQVRGHRSGTYRMRTVPGLRSPGFRSNPIQ